MSEKDDVREFRLEGVGLVVVAVALIAAFAAAFVFGRWFERRQRPDDLTLGAGRDPLAEVVEGDETSVDDRGDYFDTLQSAEAAPLREEETTPEAELEPVPGASTGERPAGGPEPAADAADAEATGRWAVQVFAGRQRDSAQKVLDALLTAGHRARVDEEVVEGERLYRVRAGGWDDREAAVEAAERLKTEGFRGAFAVDRGDG